MKLGKKCTLCCICLHRCCFGLEVKVIIKISTHPFFPRNFDWFSWGWSKKDFFFFLKKHQCRSTNTVVRLFVFFASFRLYFGQPDHHIDYATLMPFTSIYQNDSMIDPWNFREKILKIGGFEKLSFLESAILKFIFLL